ncbi:hypothetical protein ABL78_8384 [Leptomonas seymouri]|uniref:Uncharacterized protein n=1 Tax=Leptomonas seymouri TaxID=5684 RepID=A0A0N0P270_LEPSE|nr:hypothetical protein ABL78_8384 [Leptomonas seymouri]|eukprot:KPI82606.1 hypothetical protein ABL78_8384 [Leptomonas seymouri]
MLPYVQRNPGLPQRCSLIHRPTHSSTFLRQISSLPLALTVLLEVFRRRSSLRCCSDFAFERRQIFVILSAHLSLFLTAGLTTTGSKLSQLKTSFGLRHNQPWCLHFLDSLLQRRDLADNIRVFPHITGCAVYNYVFRHRAVHIAARHPRIRRRVYTEGTFLFFFVSISSRRTSFHFFFFRSLLIVICYIISFTSLTRQRTTTLWHLPHHSVLSKGRS